MRGMSFSALLLLAACQGTTPPAEAPSASSPPEGAEPSPNTPVSSPPQSRAPEPGAGGPAWVTRRVDPEAPEDWRTCTGSDECTLVQTTCCDVCNGGSVVAVTKEHAKDAENEYQRGDCSRTMCTERGCMTRAACEDGRCVLQWGNFR